MAVNHATVRNRPGSKKPHLVTININGTRRTNSFTTKTAATKYQTKLNQAVNAGEEFDPATGEPASWAVTAEHEATVYDLATLIVSRKWPGLLATSRKGIVEALAHVIAATSLQVYERRHTYTLACHALVPNAALTDKQADEWTSIQQVSPPVSAVRYDDVHATISFNLDGSTPVATTVHKRVQMLDLLVETATGERPTRLEAKGTRTHYPRKVSSSVIGTVPEALSVLSAVHLDGPRRALLLMLYAGVRPSEAIALPWEYVNLTEGVLIIAKNTPVAGARFTDGKGRSDIQPPKWRPRGSSRTVPIVAPLAVLLNDWARTGTQSGLVCTTTTDTPIPTNDLSKAWKPARKTVGKGWASERLGRPYDLRHTHASIALNAGVPIPEVAARLGHSPAELLRTYAAVIHADQQRWTDVMSNVFGR